MACRFALGAFESGNWPCALRTTQRILKPNERTLGNGVLQSGAALGAIIIPQVVNALVVGPGTWPRPFFVVGAVGTLWVVFWLATVRQADLALPASSPAAPASSADTEGHESLLAVVLDRRFLACAVIGITINVTWHFFRVWMPLFLQESRGYGEVEVNHFASAYYAAADAGSLTAGFATLYVARRGVTVHWSRAIVFLAGASLTTLSLAVAIVPHGPGLVALLLVLAFGALAVFPPYYSFTQELTTRHQGKLTGMLSCMIWVCAAVMHPLVGKWLDHTKDYSTVVGLAGLFPLVGFAAFYFLWRSPRPGTGSFNAVIEAPAVSEEGVHPTRT